MFNVIKKDGIGARRPFVKLSLRPCARDDDGTVFDPHEAGLETTAVEWWELYVTVTIDGFPFPMQIGCAPIIDDLYDLLDIMENRFGMYLKS